MVWGILMLFSCFPGSSQSIDSLNQLISSHTHKDSLSFWLEKAGNYYFNIDLDSARYYYEQALPLYNQPGQRLLRASLLKRMAISFALQGQQDSAIQYMEESLFHYEQIHDSLQMAFSHNNLGLMHADNNNYPGSMEHLVRAHQIKSALLNQYPIDQLDLAGTELNMGITYHYIEDFENAGRYYTKAGESFAIQKDSFGMLNADLQMANLYFDLEQYERAKTIYQSLLDESLIRSRPFVYSKLLNNYATLLYRTAHFEKAETFLREAYEMNLKMGNKQSAVKNLNNLAEISLLNNQLNQALEYGEKSLRICEENGFRYSEEVILKILAEAYEAKGNFREALALQKRKEVLSDSLYNSEKNKLLTEMETRYQTEQKEKELTLKNLEIERVNRSRFWFILLSGLLVVFSIVFYSLYRDRKKKNELLQHSIRTKDKLISIIAHDLKNPAIAQKTAIHHLLQYIDQLKKEDIQPQLLALYQSSESQVTLLHNLLNWAHTQTGHMDYHPGYFTLDSVIRKNIDLFETTAHNKNLSFEVSGDPEWTVFADKPSIHTVLRNLISNAIKFSHGGNRIEIGTEPGEHGRLKCFVRDKGIGMTEDKIKRLFAVGKRELSRGTEGEQGSGLGLILCKEMLAKNGGELFIESRENEGTVISFTLPTTNPAEK
jgi:signal transduction histidine kinase